MKRRGFAIWLVAVASFLLDAGSVPRDRDIVIRSHVIRLEPDRGIPGDIVTALGEQLDRTRVEELYLTDGSCTALVTIVQQNEVAIRFRIPTHIPSGRYRVVLLLAGRYSRGVEQTVVLTVL